MNLEDQKKKEKKKIKRNQWLCAPRIKTNIYQHENQKKKKTMTKSDANNGQYIWVLGIWTYGLKKKKKKKNEERPKKKKKITECIFWSWLHEAYATLKLQQWNNKQNNHGYYYR